MKNKLGIVFAGLSLFGLLSTAAIAETKIAVLNYQAVLFNSTAANDATLQLRTALAPEQSRLQDLSQQIETRRSRLETDQELMTEEEIDQFKRDIQSMMSEQAQLSALMQQRQQESRNAFVKQFQPFVRTLVESYVEENKITIVIDAQAVLWNQGEPDITESILAAFDKEYQAKKLEASSAN